jgi:chromate reductase, NAD(P)H dehydrogenase (quinone)
MPRLLCFPGSLRAASSSTALLKALVARIGAEAEVELADIAALPHYNADHDGGEPVARLVAQLAAADGVLFVTPEYNYSVPGVLKNAIDWASRPAYQSGFRGKRCFCISVSGGAMGGVRAQGHLKYILNGMLAEVFPWQEIIVTTAPKRMTDGIFTDTEVLDFAMTGVTAFLQSLPKA